MYWKPSFSVTLYGCKALQMNSQLVLTPPHNPLHPSPQSTAKRVNAHARSLNARSRPRCSHIADQRSREESLERRKEQTLGVERIVRVIYS
uniref:Uncharacterized protein n=1 Tax=Knipowitschia caucasica TaxID=637954 RepID=A0AAV2J1N9_KNICA